MTKKNIVEKRQASISYLNRLISLYEDKINYQLSSAVEERKNFIRNLLLFLSIMVASLGLAFVSADTFLETFMIIITSPFVATSSIGIPLTIITEVSIRLEDKKRITKYQKLLNSAQKRKFYETKFLEEIEPKKVKLNLEEIITSMVNYEEKEAINSSNESIPELDRLLLETNQVKREKIPIKKDKPQKTLKEKEHSTIQELSYDQKQIINSELETYTFAIKSLLRAKREGKLAEFLKENYNVTDEESLAMYNALLEEETHPNILLEEDKVPLLEAVKQKIKS